MDDATVFKTGTAIVGFIATLFASFGFTKKTVSTIENDVREIKRNKVDASVYEAQCKHTESELNHGNRRFDRIEEAQRQQGEMIYKIDKKLDILIAKGEMGES